MIFAVASIAQLICGRMLDRLPARNVFSSRSSLQVLFFALMPGLGGWTAIIVAVGSWSAPSARCRSPTI